MTPSGEKRSWMYGIAWLGGGVASGGLLGWLIWIVAYRVWPAGTEAQRLGILGQMSYGLLFLMGFVTLGLTIRNAIRNIKGTVAGNTIEATGKDHEDV